jgi:hypothetical protein
MSICVPLIVVCFNKLSSYIFLFIKLCNFLDLFVFVNISTLKSSIIHCWSIYRHLFNDGLQNGTQINFR